MKERDLFLDELAYTFPDWQRRFGTLAEAAEAAGLSAEFNDWKLTERGQSYIMATDGVFNQAEANKAAAAATAADRDVHLRLYHESMQAPSSDVVKPILAQPDDDDVPPWDDSIIVPPEWAAVHIDSISDVDLGIDEPTSPDTESDDNE